MSDHYKAVENFFNDHKEAKFITYDITNDDISKLTKYIDIKKYKMMPHKNHKIRENKVEGYLLV